MDSVSLELSSISYRGRLTVLSNLSLFYDVDNLTWKAHSSSLQKNTFFLKSYLTDTKQQPRQSIAEIDCTCPYNKGMYVRLFFVE